MQAASNLGASPVRAFCSIYLPLSVSGLAAGSLIVFVLCLGFYVTPAVLGGGRVVMVATQITAILEHQFDWALRVRSALYCCWRLSWSCTLQVDFSNSILLCLVKGRLNI